MTSQRRSVTSQILASIAVVALPLCLYAPVVREGSGRVSRIYLVALVSHCVEVEAFLWLVLTPVARSSLARWRGTCTTPAPLSAVPAAWLRGTALLRLGPCLAAVMPVVGWGAGYRLPGFLGLKEAFLLLVLACNGLVLIPLGLYLATASLIRRSGAFPRCAATVALLVLAIPCFWSIEPASELGRTRLEYELGLAHLASNCVGVVEARGRPGEQQMLRAYESGSAAIQRLRPSYVIVEHDRVRIELHGGFDHYGYRLTRDNKNGRWVLEWYTEGGPDQSLLAWPIGRNP
jgi:hypothetical protein